MWKTIAVVKAEPVPQLILLYESGCKIRVHAATLIVWIRCWNCFRFLQRAVLFVFFRWKRNCLLYRIFLRNGEEVSRPTSGGNRNQVSSPACRGTSCRETYLCDKWANRRAEGRLRGGEVKLRGLERDKQQEPEEMRGKHTHRRRDGWAEKKNGIRIERETGGFD